MKKKINRENAKRQSAKRALILWEEYLEGPFFFFVRNGLYISLGNKANIWYM